MLRLQQLLPKVRWTNHESDSTNNSLSEEGDKEINETRREVVISALMIEETQKESPTYDLELTIEVHDLQNDTNTIVWNSQSGKNYDHKSKKALTCIEKGDPCNDKGQGGQTSATKSVTTK